MSGQGFETEASSAEEDELKRTKRAGMVIAGLIALVLISIAIGMGILFGTAGKGTKQSAPTSETTNSEVTQNEQVSEGIFEADGTDPEAEVIPEVGSEPKPTTETAREELSNLQRIPGELSFKDQTEVTGTVQAKEAYETSKGQMLFILDIWIPTKSSDSGLVLSQVVTLSSYESVEVGSKLNVGIRMSDKGALAIEGLSVSR